MSKSVSGCMYLCRQLCMYMCVGVYVCIWG